MLMQRKAQSRGFSEHSLISGRQERGEGSTLCSQLGSNNGGAPPSLGIHLMRTLLHQGFLPWSPALTDTWCQQL